MAASEANRSYRFVQRLLRLGFQALQGLEVEGLSAVPERGPLLLVSNHLSWLDPPVLGCSLAHRQIHFMAKQELFDNRWLGPLIRTLGAFPVERGQADRKSLRMALELLGRGRVVGLFPEGTRGPGPSMQAWQVGMAMLAQHAQVPVHPAVVHNTRWLLEDRASPGPQPRPPIRVRFGEAVDLSRVGGKGKSRLHDIQNRCFAAVEALLTP